MKKWDYSDIPSQKGRVAIVTGANSGLGFYTTRGLVSKGCEVIMGCRNIKKAELAKDLLKNDFPDALIEVMNLDLGDLGSVKEFADRFTRKYKKLDLLINNAGLMAIPFRKTVDGFEMQFGVNHLGHFALTGHLFDTIRNTKGARIVNVSSSAHNIGKIRFEDIHWTKNYKKWKAYGMSKLANIHFTLELADRVTSLGLDTIVLAAHPGYADTKLMEKGPEMNGRKFLIKAGQLANKLIAQSAEMGALPTLYAATADEAVNRGYYGPKNGMRGYPDRTYPNRKKISKHEQEQLWELSQALTGISFLNMS